MSAITMVKEIKALYPETIIFVKSGGFYKVYGKDAYIVSKIFGYKLKKSNEIFECGFPNQTINKVRAVVEKKKINYALVESRSEYTITDKEEFGNLNRYVKEYQEAKIYINKQIRIEEIYEFLCKNIKKENIKSILQEIEDIIDAKGKI